MGNTISASIRTATIHLAFQDLLATYQRELAESQADDDTWFMEYWKCACQTVYDVAAALHIPFEEPSEEPPSKPRPYKQCPRQPDSLTPTPADVELPEDGKARLRYL